MTTTLGQISLPDKEIEQVFSSHDALSQSELLHVFSIIINKISNGIESIHLATFTLEQQVKREEYSVKALDPLENSMVIMEPLIQVLSDLSDIIFNKGEEGDDDQNEQVQLQQEIKITRIQSEWSSLQHFLASVKKQVITSNNEKELVNSIELVMIQIDDISTMIFDFQEKKHASAAGFVGSSTTIGSSVALSTSSSSTAATNTTIADDNTTTPTQDFSMDTKWLQNSKDDQLMIAIDNAFEPLLQSIEHIYHRMNSMQILDKRLNRLFDKMKQKWELLQYERDELKFEHKEDRWLAVFRRVADKVDAMIDGLDRSVVQCYNLIQQTRDWQASNHATNVFDKFSKSFIRSIHHQNQQQVHILPVDKEQFKSIEKSFEAKYKYYTPSIDRMLSMLGNGISARATRDNPTSQRHDTMVIRWNHLKEVMDELRSRDLIETERIISATTSTSSSSIQSTSTESRNNWRNIRYRTPEPSSQMDIRTVRSITPNSASSIGRSSPRKLSTSHYDHPSLLRGSISDSSSVGSIPSVHLPPPQLQQPTATTTRKTKTPRPTRNASISINKRNQDDFYDEDERNCGIDMMKLSHTRPPSVNTLRRSQAADRPLGSMVRSKTPNPPTTTRTQRNNNNSIRSKSSMGQLMTNRTMSPSNMKRSVTPSLIPRPKTPKEEINSPMIPRPKSQLRHNKHLPPPPVPPIPKYVISHENDYASYRDPNLILRKKQSMPTLRNNHKNNTTTTMEISFSEDAIYHPDPKDPLDIEVGQIVNASPISIQCQKAQQGRYYFGNELSMSSMGGKKMYTCKLMTYGDRRGGQYKNNKVLIRVGGGWQDLEFFLLEHSSLMASDVVVRSFQSNNRGGGGGTGWR